MRLYLEKINIFNSNIKNMLDNTYKKCTQIKETYIYTNEGIYKYDKHSLNKCIIIDKDIYKNDDILFDNSIIEFKEGYYQIPHDHKIIYLNKYIYFICKNLNIILYIDNNNNIDDLYIDTNLKYDFIKEEISSFMALFN